MRIIVLILLVSFTGCVNKNNIETFTTDVLLDTTSVEYLLDKNNHNLEHAHACMKKSDSIANEIIKHEIYEDKLMKQLIKKKINITKVSDSVSMVSTKVDTVK